MNWLAFGILAAGSFGFYNVFTKIAGERISPTVSLMFTAGTSFIVALVVTIVFKLAGHNLVVTKSNIVFPILAGISTGIAEIFYLYMYSKHAPVSIGTPFVLAGTMLIAVILGLVFLKEGFSLFKMIGVVLTLAGLFILSK